MKKISILLILISLIFNNLLATTYSSDPKLFVKDLVSDALNKLSDKSLTDDERASFVETVALDNVDINALGFYTLGEIRKSANENDLNKYKKVFEKYFLKSLTSRLTDYSSNKIEIISAEVKNSNYTIVKSRIVESANQPEIKIDWRIYTKNQERPLIRDLIIEGLSLARTQKEEFASVLNSNNGDIDALFQTLKNFSNK